MTFGLKRTLKLKLLTCHHPCYSSVIVGRAIFGDFPCKIICGSSVMSDVWFNIFGIDLARNNLSVCKLKYYKQYFASLKLQKYI